MRIHATRPAATVLATLLVAATTALPARERQQAGTRPIATSPQDQHKQHKHVNRLAQETSPYLLSHKNNPVDWYPWGKAAFDLAKKTGKPIFLSVGYAACHWCHVMERESFESEAVAKELNKYFVCIKVDREERPDVDAIYMTAVQQFTRGGGGWPMSVFLTPDRKPFYGGTYFPPQDARGRPGFLRVVKTLGEAWRNKRELVEKDAEQMALLVKSELNVRLKKGKLDLAFLKTSAQQSLARWDREYGGFGSPGNGYRPKFPHASEITALLINHARFGDKESLQIAVQTLDKMARGGIYDHVAGGFHRYSVDRKWLVPHFEKMLYDNSLLAQSYLDAFQHTGNVFFRRVATETLDYLIREMQGEQGGFYSTTDADSEGVEGKYFVWTKAETDRLLGENAALFNAVYGVTEAGNWHEMKGVTVLSKVLTEAAAAQQFHLEEGEVAARLAAARKVLYEARRKRVPPLKDDKIITAWNGMAITAMARGYLALGEERYLNAARRAASFVLQNLRRENGRLLRSWRQGQAKFAGYLADYGYLADGLAHLFECDFDARWLRASKDLLAVTTKHFRDAKHGSFFTTADDHEALLSRNRSINEGSIPSGAAMVIRAYVRTGLLLADQSLVQIGQEGLEACHETLSRTPAYVPSMLSSLDLLLSDPREVVIAGELDQRGTQAFLERTRSHWPPTHVTTVLNGENRAALAKLIPAHATKAPADGKPACYVCKFGSCDAPITDAAKLKLK